MEIIWHGQACFRLKGKQATVVIDPFDPTKLGIKLPKLTADAVLITHDHFDHNYTVGVSEGNPVIIAGPGEYEIKGIAISGIQTFHDDKLGEERGKNTVYHLTMDGISIVHLGDLGHTLSKEQITAIGACDVLMVPVGSVYTIDAGQAAEVVTQLEPSIVLPMHYKLEGLKVDLDPVEKFLKEIGKERVMPQPKLVITKEKLPEETETVILEKQ